MPLRHLYTHIYTYMYTYKMQIYKRYLCIYVCIYVQIDDDRYRQIIEMFPVMNIQHIESRGWIIAFLPFPGPYWSSLRWLFCITDHFFLISPFFLSFSSALYWGPGCSSGACRVTTQGTSKEVKAWGVCWGSLRRPSTWQRGCEGS